MAFVQSLDYENDLLVNLLEEDVLLIMAKGLGLDRIILNAIQPFCDPETLVFVLNTSNEEQLFFIEELRSVGVQHLPSVITQETGSVHRESLYLQGGVFFVTSRILVVDMLAKRVPMDYIYGIIVHRAHKIGETSQEAFILRMFRESNCNGFIKGVTDSPSAFLSGFAQVERIMKRLFVHKLLLLPRFHENVQNCLEKHKPDVVELSVSLTPLMTCIQLSIFDLITCCLRELKKSSPSCIDGKLLTLENCLAANFNRSLQFQLDPQWNILPKKTKQLVQDLRTLRTLLVYLTQYDCITFYHFLTSLRTTSASRDSIWLYLDAANNLFHNAKARVYGAEKSAKGSKSDKSSADDCFEVSPKWDALKQILDEIEEENMKAGEANEENIAGEANEENIATTGKVLVTPFDERTCKLLTQFLSEGADIALKNVLFEKSSADKNLSKSARSKYIAGQMKKKADQQSKDGVSAVDAVDEDVKFNVNVLPNSTVVIHPLSGTDDPYMLLRKLYELQPKYVVLYDVKMEFVRQLEVYKALRPGVPLRVYFLFYESSVDEQRYLTNLRKENEAFEVLIQQKIQMVIPEERSGKSDIARSLIRDKPDETDAGSSTRKAGGREAHTTKLVIVDMREFRSELPSLLHKRGMDVDPVTLEVGDYILSPDICIERKSVSDLIGSLNNGRLYTQCVAMTRFYTRPILLVEFSDGKSFALQGKQSTKDEVSLKDISSKLTLLTIHFPKLRIIWSESPQLTAEIFEDLKLKQKEPDAKVAMSVGIDYDNNDSNAATSSKFNMVPSDVIQKFPGITCRNYRRVMHRYTCLKDLVNEDEAGVSKALENGEFGKRFHDFVTREEDKETIDLVKKKKK